MHPSRRSRWRVAALLGLLVLGPGGFARADASADPSPATADRAWPEGLRLYAVDNFRWEVWRFFDPAAPGGDPDYDFVANRLRVGAKLDRPHFGLHVAGQYVQLGSVPSDAAGMPGGALGTGALYFAHARERSPEALQLKALELELRDLLGRDLDLTVGRFSYSSGREADSGVAKIEAVKRMRIADRLIGEFGWSHFQRSFDGARLRWGTGPGVLSVAALRPTEGGFEDGGTRRMDDIDVLDAAWTWRPGRLLPGTEVQAFYAFYGDERRVAARVDNTGLPAPDRQDIHIHTFGGHLVGAWPLGSGELDAMVWGGLQTGRWLRMDHRAAAAALELGYQWTERPGRPWLRMGSFRSTGDGAPGDSEHETFFQMLPTARLYSLTAAYNLMNSTDSFVELRVQPTGRMSLVADVHDLRLSNANDLWYAGAGATQDHGTILGFAGRSSGGHRHLGTVAELSAQVRVHENASVQAFYGHLWGGNVVETSFADGDDLDFFYLELTLRSDFP